MKTLLSLLRALMLGLLLGSPASAAGFFLNQQGYDAIHSAPSTTWNAADYGTPRVWLSARNETGITNNTAISPQTDFGGEGNNATQATTSKKPIYRTGQLGAALLPAVAYDGIDDCAVTPSMTLPMNGFSFCIVLQQTTLFFTEQSANAFNPGLGFFLYGGVGNTFLANSTAPILGRGVDASAGSGWIGTNACVLAGSFDGTTLTLLKNGSAVSLGSYTGPVQSASATAVLNIASRNQTSVFSQCLIGEYVIWPTTQTGASLTNMSAGLNAVYQLY